MLENNVWIPGIALSPFAREFPKAIRENSALHKGSNLHNQRPMAYARVYAQRDRHISWARCSDKYIFLSTILKRSFDFEYNWEILNPYENDLEEDEEQEIPIVGHVFNNSEDICCFSSFVVHLVRASAISKNATHCSG